MISFLRRVFIGIPQNKYHPLTWLNGHPTIGKNTYIGGFSEINAKGGFISIGNNCDISSFVSINVADSHKFTIGASSKIKRGEITIGNNTFIGSHSFIGGKSHIGSFCVISAGSIIIDKVIPDYSLVIGRSNIEIKSNYYKNKYSRKK